MHEYEKQIAWFCSSVDIRIVCESCTCDDIKYSSSLLTLNFNKQKSLKLDSWRDLIGCEFTFHPPVVHSPTEQHKAIIVFESYAKIWLHREKEREGKRQREKEDQPVRMVHFNTLTSNGNCSFQPTLIEWRKTLLHPALHIVLLSDITHL